MLHRARRSFKSPGAVGVEDVVKPGRIGQSIDNCKYGDSDGKLAQEYRLSPARRGVQKHSGPGLILHGLDRGQRADKHRKRGECKNGVLAAGSFISRQQLIAGVVDEFSAVGFQIFRMGSDLLKGSLRG